MNSMDKHELAVRLRDAGKYAASLAVFVSSQHDLPLSKVKEWLSPAIETQGELAICGGPRGNVIMLTNTTREVVDIINETKARGWLDSKQTEPLVYMIDGAPMPAMPVAKRLPTKGYKNPHWLPSLLIEGPSISDAFEAEEAEKQGAML